MPRFPNFRNRSFSKSNTLALCASCQSGKKINSNFGCYCTHPHRENLIVQYAGDKVTCCAAFRSLRAAKVGVAV